MSIFERYLTLWVALCIVAGVALGHLMPAFFGAVASAEVAKVNLPVAVLIWLMIVPMLLKIDFGSLGQVREHWRGVGVRQPRGGRQQPARLQARQQRIRFRPAVNVSAA